VSGGTAGWLRVAAGILERIGAGELKPGCKIPPKAVLAGELGVGIHSARQAMDWLAAKDVARLTPQNVYVLTPSARERAAALAAAGFPAADAEPGTPRSRLAWAALARTLDERIRSGQYTGRMPSRDALVAETGRSQTTVVHALGELAGRGLIYYVPGHGYHVTPQHALRRREIGRGDLVLAWGADWAVDCPDGTWQAVRHDGRGEVLTAGTAEELNALIRDAQEKLAAAR
jgi:DNA-binding GntR family transcriptional regulator